MSASGRPVLMMKLALWLGLLVLALLLYLQLTSLPRMTHDPERGFVCYRTVLQLQCYPEWYRYPPWDARDFD